MLENDADCQLLFGLLAIQLRIVSVADISRGLGSWSENRSSSLKTILTEAGVLDAASGELIDSAVTHHIGQAQGDPRRGLGAFAGNDALQALLGVVDRTFNSPTEGRHDSPAPVECSPRSHTRGPAPQITRAGDRGRERRAR